MAETADQKITITLNGVEHTIDMKKINEIYAAIAAGPGDTPGEKVALAMTDNPLVTAAAEPEPDPESRGE